MAWICSILLKTTLTYFDRTQLFIVQTDASDYGFSTTLVQNGWPITFASKTLTNVETLYVNMEGGCLSVYFGLEKVHTYIYGHHVTVQNDHKHLDMIQHKPIHAASPQIQCILLWMQKWYVIEYRPRKDMVLADHLSCFPSHQENLPIILHHNTQHIHFSSDKLNWVWGVVERDLVHSTLYWLTLKGWHDHITQVPMITLHFWGTWDELSFRDGILTKWDQICIPPEMFNCTLADLHEGHQGVENASPHPSPSVLAWHWCWHCQLHLKCTICAQHKATQPVQLMLLWDEPNGQWQDIAANYLNHKGKDYFLVCDAFRKYPLEYRVPTKMAKSLKQKIQELVSQHRPTRRLHTDNELPFSSEEFSQYH